MTWPAEPVVAMAYIDQLKRANALSDDRHSALTEALDKAKSKLNAGEVDAETSKQIRDLAAGLETQNPNLQETLNKIAARIK